MKTKRVWKGFGALVLGGTLIACASTEGESSGDGDLDFTVGESFKLYESRTSRADSFCDKHKLLTLTKSTATERTFVFESKIGGTCSLAPLPDKVQFVVKKKSVDACGSVTFVGTGKALAPENANGTAQTVSIVDHRKRTCADERARLEVTIGTNLPLYAPKAVPPAADCKVGTRTFAEGEKFSDRCNTCTCTKQNGAMCTEIACL